MAPGIGGNGGGSRQTGTVPKTKSQNESSREYNGTSRRDDHHFNHAPNNLSSLLWQPANDSNPHSRSRKESNTSASRYSEIDTNYPEREENVVSQDNLWFSSNQQRSQPYHSDDDEASQASWVEGGYKSNNLGLPDKAQVATRLHQIREYVSQTVSMMDGLRASGGQRNMAQHEKLSSMLEGLRDSEIRLQSLHERLEHMPPPAPSHTEEGEPVEGFLAQPSSSGAKSADAARKNELTKQVQHSQFKLQELMEQQASLKALRQKAQQQLTEAKLAQEALMDAHRIVAQENDSSDNMIQERLKTLQRFFRTREQMLQMTGAEQGAHPSEMQNKLDELEAKKNHLDQLLAQFGSFNISSDSENMTVEECAREMDSKMAELSAMREALSVIQSNMNMQMQARAPSQERMVKKETCPAVEKSNTPTNQAIQVKSQQLQDARVKLQQLQSLLNTVEQLREAGQPIPDSMLQLMGGSEHGSSPTHPDRSEMSSQSHSQSQELNLSQSMNGSDRNELFSERGGRSHIPCDRQPSAGAKHNNQQSKYATKMQLEDLIRNQELSLPPPLLSSSFNENGTTGAWGGSSQGNLEENFNSVFVGDMNESASVKNTTNPGPQNVWRKPSSGSGASRSSWTTPYVPQEISRGHRVNSHLATAAHPPVSHAPLPVSPQATTDTLRETEPQAHMQRMNELRRRIHRDNGCFQNLVQKDFSQDPPVLPSNGSSPWMPPVSMTSALGPYCQYISSLSQWQQQQLLVNSLNQCCQLIWHQQQELGALKEALQLLQRSHPQPEARSHPQPQLPQEQAHTHFSPEPEPEGIQERFIADADQLSAAHADFRQHISSRSRVPHHLHKPSQRVEPTLASPPVLSCGHSLPNLVSPTPASPLPTSAVNHNVLSSPTATVLSLPPILNRTVPSIPQHNPNLFFNRSSQFTDPNFINHYPPYGNNLNFEFPSPVNFFPNPPEPFLTWATSSQTQPATTLNNQVPPGNRANNYWDNFRSYSRQNLLSGSSKSNEGLPQRTPLERYLNTDQLAHPRDQPYRARKERLNAQSVYADVNNLSWATPASGADTIRVTQSLLARARALVPPDQEMVEAPEEEDQFSGAVGGYQPSTSMAMPHSYQHNLCDQAASPVDVKPSIMRHPNSAHSFQHSRCNEVELRTSESQPSARLVNDCELLRSNNKVAYSHSPASSERKPPISKRNYIEAPAREAKLSQLNNYQTEPSEFNAESELGLRSANLMSLDNPTHSHNVNTHTQHNCIGNGYCLMACDKGVRRKDNRGNIAKECKTELNKGESLKECVYSEVAALISNNEWRPQFLLQLFKDLRLLSCGSDANMQAVLSSIHSLAARSAQEDRGPVADQPNDHSDPAHSHLADPPLDNSSQQPCNWSHKDPTPQLPSSWLKLDWEVRSVLVEVLEWVRAQVQAGEMCTATLLESLRRLVLHLVTRTSHSQLNLSTTTTATSTITTADATDQLDAQLEDALLRFHSCRLGDVYEELLAVLADVLTSELTFLRLINNVNHTNDQSGREDAVEEEVEEEEEGAVGGVMQEVIPSPILGLYPNQARRTMNETVSEADQLCEADQSRHTNSGEEEERGDSAEGIDHQEDEAQVREISLVNCNGSLSTDSNAEASWAVEQDRELGLDQVPTRLNPPSADTEHNQYDPSSDNPGPPTSDPGPV